MVQTWYTGYTVFEEQIVMENITKYDFSEKISKKRRMGKADDAVDIALQAKEKYPKENIFDKLLGELFSGEKV